MGAPTELLIHTIDVGMLAPPRNKFEFAKDPEAHREYFQTAPVSRLIVSQYAPLFLPEVMLPNGTLLTDHDPSKGDWHNGTMRQSIGKELISLGIDNANYGLHSTAGEGESSHPYLAAQLAAHATVGKYSNGLVVHGGSGGGGSSPWTTRCTTNSATKWGTTTGWGTMWGDLTDRSTAPPTRSIRRGDGTRTRTV